MANYNAGNLDVEFLGIDKSLSGTLETIIARLEKLEKVTNNLGRAGKNNKQGIGDFFSFSSFAKIGTFLTSMRRVARVGQQILQYGVDYTETLNLWQVAMGNNLSMAREFVTQMNRAYGISEKTLMNAQAIFKNMIGSLGQVGEATAYKLSEAITQMAVDYASLYNVGVDSAITKFQAALAGQVRPIRSVSGYDITENTLYQLYQSIGGTKTMRQLSRTEKQLLSIYAVFQQMGASGALGDMEKTIDQVANQSRMMAENWKTAGTWAGISLQYILQETGAFKTINAILITMGEIFKSIAFSLGYETPDFANDWADNVQNTNEEIDKLKGKLLGFDKFRSLGQADTNALSIDETLLDAISGYTSQIDVSINKARELAETFLEMIGFVDENNDGIYEITQKTKGLFIILSSISALGIIKLLSGNKNIAQLGALGKVLTAIKTPLGIIVGILGGLYLTNEQFRNSINELIKSLLTLTIDAISPFAKILGVLIDLTGIVAPILTGIVDIVHWVVKLADKLNILEPLIYIILSYKLKGWLSGIGGALVPLYKQFVQFIPKAQLFLGVLDAAVKNGGLKSLKGLIDPITKSFGTFLSSTKGLTTSISILIGGIISFVTNFDKLSSSAKIWIPIIATLVGVVTALAAGFTILKGNWVGALSLGALVTGIGLMVGTALSIPKYEEGGLPDKGTMFIAGEAGAEMVYNTPSGQSGVANISQIQQAMYGALVAYGRTQGGDNGQPIVVQIDGEKVFQATQKSAKKHGLAFSRV